MSQEITTQAIGNTAELARPNPNPSRGLTRQSGQAMDDFGSTDPPGPVEMQEFSFFDFLDIINPLQHIPIVSSLYRAATGDEMKPFARIIGGALFGGPSGFMRGIAEAILEEGSGKDIGQHVAALFDGGDAAPVATLRLAEARTPADANVPAVVALGLETLADGPSEWAIAQRAGTADTWPAPANEPGIAGGVADSRLIGDSEPLATPTSLTVPTLDAATAARVKAFMATKPGAPIDKATLKWLVEATPIVSAAAAAFGKPDPASLVLPPPAGGLGLAAVTPPGLDATVAPPRWFTAPATAVTAPSIATPSAAPVAPAPAPPSLGVRLEEQQSSREPAPQRVPFASTYREEFYEATFRAGPRQWQSPVMFAEPQTLPGLTPHRIVAATDPDLPMIPTLPTPAAAGPAAPGRQLAAAGLSDLPAIAVSPDSRVPAFVAAGEPVLDRPSGPPGGTGIDIERTAFAAPPPLPRPKPAVTVSRAAPPRIAPVRTAVLLPRADIPVPAADGPRAEHDEAGIAAASAAWLRAMPMARPMPAGLAELEAPALRQTMTATPAPPAKPALDAADPTAMLSNELLAQVMMSNLDKYADLARRRHSGPVMKASLN